VHQHSLLLLPDKNLPPEGSSALQPVCEHPGLPGGDPFAELLPVRVFPSRVGDDDGVLPDLHAALDQQTGAGFKADVVDWRQYCGRTAGNHFWIFDHGAVG
jgi:hypothetical protein